MVEEGLTLYRQLGDEEGIASALTNLGMTAVLGQREDIPLRTVMEELGELKPRLENRTTLAYLLILEGMIALSLGDLEHSAAPHEESIELFRETQDARGILSCLLHLGGIALAGGDYEGCLAAARSQLDEETWSGAWEQGKAMPLKQVVEYALSEEEEEHEEAPVFVAMPEQHPPTYERTQRLTTREQEVALLVGRGLTNHQIAQELSISERTAEYHVGRILEKL